MLHTKFRENQPAGSGEEDFWRVFTIYGCGGHLDHVTQMPRTKFCSPYPRRLHIKFHFDWPIGFREDDLWALWTTDDRRTTDGRRTGLAIDRSIWVLTRPVVNTGFNRSIVVDWWSIGRLKRPWSVEDTYPQLLSQWYRESINILYTFNKK